MNRSMFDGYLWLFIFIGSGILLGLLSVLLDDLKKDFLKILDEKKDKKFFNRVMHGLLSSNHSKKRKGNPIIHIDKMSGTQFEIFLKEMFKTLGYNVKRTPDSGDFGADLYMEKNGNSYVVQAKRSKTKIGLAAVQEVVAAKAYYKAEVAIVITNNHLTTNAKILAKNNNVIVYERHELIKLIHKSKMVKKG